MGHIPLLRCRQFRANRNPQVLLIGVALAHLQQLSGINIIFNYAEEIYHSAGYGDSGILFNIEITRNDQSSADSARTDPGRPGLGRFLMLFECAGIALSHLVLGLSYRVGIKGLPVLLITLCTIWLLRPLPLPRDLVLDFGNLPESCSRYRVSILASALWSALFVF